MVAFRHDYMASSLTRTSSPIQISATVTELTQNTFASEEIDLTLNALDQEVFVVTQVNLDVDTPDPNGNPGTYQVNASLSTTKRVSVGGMGNSNVIASARNEIVTADNSAGEFSSVSFSREDPVFAPTDMDYIGIIATNNAFLNIQGLQNAAPKAAQCRIYGYRAKASASVYAALVQSELLSA